MRKTNICEFRSKVQSNTMDHSENPDMFGYTQNKAPADAAPIVEPSKLQSTIQSALEKAPADGTHIACSYVSSSASFYAYDGDGRREPAVNRARFPLLDKLWVAKRTHFETNEEMYGGSGRSTVEQKSNKGCCFPWFGRR